jgi:CubicO group peptidase (beta-lactamase class C family)
MPLTALAAVLIPALVRGPEPLTDRQVRRIDHIFQAWDEPDTPGMAVGVVRDGEFVYRKAFGSADLERETPLSPDHKFYVASVSKQFTATCILLLEEQGKLSVDDLVQKHVAEFPNYDHPVLIRNLLNHTSGVKDYYTLNNMRGLSTADKYTDAEILGLVTRQSGLNFEPGTEYLYSNSGYLLLKTIVERVSGESIQAFSKKNIFDPLEMSSTQYQSSSTMLVPGRALAYSGSFQGGFNNIHSSDSTVGTRGILTTIDDFRKWHKNLLDNKLGKGSQQLIEDLEEQAVLSSGQEISYAKGVSVSRYKGLRNVGHSGSFAGYRSRADMFPDQKTSIFIFSNLASASPSALADQVSAVVLGDKFKPEEDEKPRAPKPVGAKREDLLKYIGFYQDKKKDFLNIAVGDAGLKVLVDDSVTAHLVTEADGAFYDPKEGVEVKFTESGVEFKPMKGAVRVLKKVKRVKHSPDQLNLFVGRYFSRDLKAWHEVYLKDDKLRVKAGHVDSGMWPTELGEFLTRFGLISFNREGFSLHGSRVRRIDFIKG